MSCCVSPTVQIRRSNASPETPLANCVGRAIGRNIGVITADSAPDWESTHSEKEAKKIFLTSMSLLIAFLFGEEHVATAH